MKVLHITSITHPQGNGVAVAVSNFIKYQSELTEVAIYNIESDIDEKNVISFNYNKYKSISSLPSGFSNPDLVVFNEVYKKEYLKLYKECISKNIPYIIIPHGCLVKKAQNNKKIKKKIANFLFFNSFIKCATALQYLNEDEKEKSIFSSQRYLISGNGVNAPIRKNKPKGKNFVYIGRYDIKVKGLDLLLKTINTNKEWFEKNNVKIDLYGRASGNGIVEIKKYIEKYSLNEIVSINDAIYGEEKETLLLNAYTFIQVSRHEGQPMGIMEALAYGLPCIVTYGTNFGKYVNDNECGIGIEFSEQQLFDAIKQMYNNENIRNEYSNNCEIIIKDYEWKNVTKALIHKYKRIIKERII